MSDRSTHRRRDSPGRQRHLSDDVRQRVAITARRLPLARPVAEAAEPIGTAAVASTKPVIVQAQRDSGQTGDKASVDTYPSPQQIADRVYELMRQDLHLERERGGW